MPWASKFRPTRVEAWPGGPKVLGGSEKRVALQLKAEGSPFRYEEVKLVYQEPATDHKYTPDFVLPNGVHLEVKGLLEPEDRKKHILIKEQWPTKDIRFIFDNASKPINKGSKTTYGAWCEKHGFKYSTKIIPKEWLE